jgi:hypothetical protein
MAALEIRSWRAPPIPYRREPMTAALTPPRAAVGGVAILMACACGAAANTARLTTMAGIGGSTKLIHPLLIALAAGLIVYGLYHVARRSAAVALLSLLTPPMAMSGQAMPWNALQVTGAAFYLVAAALLGYAFWRAFPTPLPAASGTAIGGVAVATGCTCCLVTGALAGLLVTGGASSVHFHSNALGLIFWTGMALAAVGLWALGGWRAALWVPAGALIIRYGPRVLSLAGDWMVEDANLRSYPSYLLQIAGATLVLYGFVVAYRTARDRAGSEPAVPVTERRFELIGA